MSTLNRRLADLEHQHPVRFIVPEIGAPVETVDAVQAMWVAIMVHDESDWRTAALQRFDARQFMDLVNCPGVFASFVDALSKEGRDLLKEGLERRARRSADAAERDTAPTDEGPQTDSLDPIDRASKVG